MSIISQSPSRLFEQSPKCKRLNVAKVHTFPVIMHYAASNSEIYQGYAHKILNCSNDLTLRVSIDIQKEGVTSRSSIESARWCRVRHCPMCGLARSSKMRARLFKGFSNYEFDENAYSFLTLTIRNCPLSELRTSINDMSKSWDRLTKRRTFPILGFLRSLEVTMQRERMPWDKKKNTGPPVRSDSGELMAHPHFHIVLHTESGFDKHLKDKQWLVDLWTQSLRSDYRPSISIDKIRPRNGDFEKSLLETCKYTTKPGDFADDDPSTHAPKKGYEPLSIYVPHGADWLYGITEQLHNLRAVRLGGTFAEICPQSVLDKIDDSCETENAESQLGRLIRLMWNDSFCKFRVVDDEEID
jgi:plasmid rolling circle replication initiator protein Rep